MYKVKKSDLVGQLAGFPIEVVQKIVDTQYEQRGYVNIENLQEFVSGCFIYENTKEGYEFWESVIEQRNFSVFFTKYPKESQSNTEVSFKDMLIQTLQDYGQLQIEVDNNGLVYTKLLIDEQTVIESQHVDLKSDIEDKSWEYDPDDYPYYDED